ncbi:MAG: RES family NAD+ phosphorylase [Cyanobium sp.]
MIRAWRLSKARYAADLTGQGAARVGQRWNPPGQRAVYLGLTPEITVLEVLVHLNGVLNAPLVLCAFDVPDGPALITEPDPMAFPEGWNSVPHGHASAAFGGEWLRVGDHLGLVLPSVVVPQARNLLLNPLHPAMAQVALVHQEPFELDARLA